MWWLKSCLLLAVVVVLSSAQDKDHRAKRDLSLIKDLLLGNLFGKSEDPAPILLRDNARIYKIHGTKGILVKAVPKAAVKVKSTEVIEDETAILKENPRIALVSSYLGTKTLNETLVSLRNIKNLLQSGLLHTQEDIEKVAPPSIFFESSNIYDRAVASPPIKDCCKSSELNKGSYETIKDVNAGGKNLILTESLFPVVLEDIHLEQSPVIYDVPVSVNPYMSLDIAPVTIPESYVYSNKHNDDILTTNTRLHHETDPVVVQITEKPRLLPDFIVNRIENAAAQAHKINYSGSKFTNNFYSTHSPGYPFVIENHGYVYEQPKKEVEVVVGNNVPSEYSYTTVHKHGASTTYTDSGEVKHIIFTNPHQYSINELKRDNNVVVVQNIQKPHPLPGLIAKRIEHIAESTNKKPLSKLSVHAPHSIQKIQDILSIYKPPREQVKIAVGSHTPVNGGYSFTTTYKDSTDTNKESTKYYFKENNSLISDKHHKTAVTLVNEHTPLPTFMTNRFENALVSTKSFKIPRHEVVEEAMYVTPIPIYERLNPIISKLPTKLEGVVTVNSHIPKSPELPKDPSQYSYTTIHKDGTKTTFSDNGLNKAAYDDNKLKLQDNSQRLVNAKDLVKNTNFEENLYQKSHVQIPTTVTIMSKPIEKNNEGYRQVLKPIISQYTYKQINNNMPDQFTIVQVGEKPKFIGDVTPGKIIDVTPYPILHSTVSMPTEYVYIPPNASTSKPVSEISLQDVTLTKHKEDVSSIETIVTSSDNSFNGNPIVVPDEPTYTHKQESQDRSTMKTIATTVNSLDRGDIPEPVF